MRSNGLTGGLILICIGIFWLLMNFGIINWSILDVMFQLWPLILIVIGINIIFKSKKFIRYITWGIFFVIIILFGFYNQYRFENDIVLDSNPNINIEKRAETTKGKLKLQLGSGNIKIKSTGDRLLRAKIPNSKVKKEVRFSNDNTNVDIDIEQRSDFIRFGDKKDYDYDLEIDETLLWNLDIDTGAINGTMDFSDLKVEKLDIDMGVSNLNLLFGDKQEKTKVDIEGGISNLEITIPENLGTEIQINGGLKNTNIHDLGWRKLGDKYISPNYDEAEKKLEIDIDTGIGRLNVREK